jgi:hypothetical protein
VPDEVRTMRSRQQKVRVTRLGRFARGQRPDRNPLRRVSDRVETAVLAVLVVAFLAAAPFTAQACGAWAHSIAHRAQVTQDASRHQVTAVVLNVATSQGTSYVPPESLAQARWTAPDGTVVTGEAPVPAGTAAGATIREWVVADGQLTDPPIENSQIADSVDTAEILAVVGLGILLAVTGWLARRALDKRRMAAWDAEWRVTEPRWTPGP